MRMLMKLPELGDRLALAAVALLNASHSLPEPVWVDKIFWFVFIQRWSSATPSRTPIMVSDWRRDACALLPDYSRPEPMQGLDPLGYQLLCIP